MIEAFWRSMKHAWLYLNQLDGFAKVKSLVAFYVEQHNTTIPHAAFDGQTPDEIYLGKGAAIPDELAERRKKARQARLEFQSGLTVRSVPGLGLQSFRACRNCARLNAECRRAQLG